jgi:hypothetical protein
VKWLVCRGIPQFKDFPIDVFSSVNLFLRERRPRIDAVAVI